MNLYQKRTAVHVTRSLSWDQLCCPWGPVGISISIDVRKTRNRRTRSCAPRLAIHVDTADRITDLLGATVMVTHTVRINGWSGTGSDLVGKPSGLKIMSKGMK